MCLELIVNLEFKRKGVVLNLGRAFQTRCQRLLGPPSEIGRRSSNHQHS